jgi:hypothetical protein
MGKCVVLHSATSYSEAHRPVLEGLLAEGIDLFCAVGVDSDGWEDAMDRLCVELDTNGKLPGAFCNTTNHPDESLADVVEFARQWNELKGEQPDVRILEI